ncbi:MAG: hypothetical protein LLF94_05975 [Chlamydiales bacterium]|nr:hypothetical protein [Chlamydiales bacterium]
MVDKIASNRILVQQDKGQSERTHQKGVRCYKTFGVLAKFFGVGITVQGEGGKTVVVNKKSYDAFLGRNPTFSGTGTATKIVSHAADMTASVKDVKKLFTDLSKEGIKIDSKVQKEIIGEKKDDEKITLSGTQLNVLKTQISKILKTNPKTSEEIQAIVLKDTKEGEGVAKVKPASVDEIKQFKFDQEKVEKRVVQLTEETPEMQAIVAGALESPDKAKALIANIAGGKAKDQDTFLNNPLGVLKDLNNTKAKLQIQQIVAKAKE